MSTRGRKRTLDYERVIEYAKTNPAATQRDIAQVFETTSWTVGEILRGAGIKGMHRGLAIKRKPGMTDEEHEWELTLHKHGLGLERGMRLGRQRIHYGYDPRQAGVTDYSATSNPTVTP